MGLLAGVAPAMMLAACICSFFASPSRALEVHWGSLAEDLARVRKSDFDGLKFFLYPLPAQFHSSLVDAMESQGQSLNNNCNFMRSPCSEDVWSGKYSVARQWGAEVIILRKFLASPARVMDPYSADFFATCHMFRVFDVFSL